jgi:hypothetical protein
MLKSLVPPLELITDDDETILFNEVCVRELSFHLRTMGWGIVVSVGIFIILLSENFLIALLQLHEADFVKHHLTKMDLFLSLLNHYASMWILYVSAGISIFLMLEVALGIFPTQVVVTNKRVILNSYSKTVRNGELPIAHIQEVLKRDYIVLICKLNHLSNIKTKHFTLPNVKQIETIHNLILEQLNNPDIQNTVIKNPFFNSERIEQVNLIHTSLILGVPLIIYLLMCWFAFYMDQRS